MKKRGESLGFTLIELMVVVTIFFILSLAAYIPYAFHQKRTLLQQSVRESSQSLYEAKNLAINGLDTGIGNNHIVLSFSKNSPIIEYRIIPAAVTFPLTLTQIETYPIYKTKNLPRWVFFEGIKDISNTTVFDEGAFIFAAISWSGFILPSALDSATQVSLIFSYQHSSDTVLQRQIQFYPSSHISDY